MKKNVFIIVFLLIVVSFIGLLIKRLESKCPIVEQNQELKFLNKSKSLSFKIVDDRSGIHSINIMLLQDNLQKEIYTEEFPGNIFWIKSKIKEKDIHISLNPAETKLKEGPATLIITAKDFSYRNKFTGNATVFKKSFIVDRTPPTLSCLSAQHYLNQGGTGFVVYQTSSDSIKNGVYVGELFYPGFPVKSLSCPDAHVAYFAMPYDRKEAPLRLFSQDEAGNELRTGFSYRIKEQKGRIDSLTISDNFLQTKMSQFFHLDESLRDMPLVDVFIKVNNQLRQKDNEKIKEICQQSSPEKLWTGKFLRLPNAKPSALFADHRSYFYQDRKIDEQFHLGVDLASLAHAPVPTANRGLVIFQGELGIYGNSIVIDHGQNIFSMYSHLSTFNVSAGQRVNQGDSVGRTGETGMAGGDHLHFSMIIGGAFVNPIEWWDEHWIEDNINLKLASLSSLN
jgi:murein DD-endopeptidase MepM/ murein hydrolase activator NlpD